MSRPRNPNGVRRAHTRNGKPVRATPIKGRQAPKKRLNAAARRRAQRKPLLAGAAGLLGLGALDAILSGRWGGFLVLGSLAVGLTVTHYAWQHHKNRQARKPAKTAKPQVDRVRLRQEARQKADARLEQDKARWAANARTREQSRRTAVAEPPAGTHPAWAKATTATQEPPRLIDKPQQDVGTHELSFAEARAQGGGWKPGDKQCNTHGNGYSAGCPSCRSIGALR